MQWDNKRMFDIAENVSFGHRVFKKILPWVISNPINQEFLLIIFSF